MGLFGKKNESELPSDFDSLNLENQKLENQDMPAGESSGAFAFTGGGPSSSNYSIDQAIKLVRSLKDHKIQPQVIAQIMKQTLESVDIHFSDIVEDSKRKESQIQAESEKKEAEIQELTKKMESLKEEGVSLQKDLDETVSVRKFLEQVIDDNKGMQKTPEPPASPKPEVAAMDTSSKEDETKAEDKPAEPQKPIAAGKGS